MSHPTRVRENLILLTIRFILKDVVLDLVSWPVWWYSQGLWQLLKSLSVEIKSYEHHLGLGLWTRSMFLPMFGQNDWQGRMISFFMRCLVLTGKFFSFLVWLLLLACFLVLWLVVIPVAGYFLIMNFFALFTLG